MCVQGFSVVFFPETIDHHTPAGVFSFCVQGHVHFHRDVSCEDLQHASIDDDMRRMYFVHS